MTPSHCEGIETLSRVARSLSPFTPRREGGFADARRTSRTHATAYRRSPSKPSARQSVSESTLPLFSLRHGSVHVDTGRRTVDGACSRTASGLACGLPAASSSSSVGGSSAVDERRSSAAAASPFDQPTDGYNLSRVERSRSIVETGSPACSLPRGAWTGGESRFGPVDDRPRRQCGRPFDLDGTPAPAPGAAARATARGLRPAQAGRADRRGEAHQRGRPAPVCFKPAFAAPLEGLAVRP